MAWERAERVQKNSSGQYRALIDGEWVPVAQAQKNSSGQFRVMRGADTETGLQERVAALKATGGNPDMAPGPKGLMGAGVSDKDRLMANPFTRIATGAAGIVGGPFQLGANIGDKVTNEVADYINKGLETVGLDWRIDPVADKDKLGTIINEYFAELDQSKRRGMAERYGVAPGEEGFDWWNLAGAVAAPSAALRNVGASAVTRGAKIAQGAKIGGTFGVTAPVTTGEENTVGTSAQGGAVGALIGGGNPATVGAAKGAWQLKNDIADLVTEGGPERIAKRYLERILPTNRQPLIDALSNPKQYVAGSPVTATEATAGVPGGSFISAQQKITGRSGGNVAGQFNDVFAQQNKAREAAIDTIAKTGPKYTQIPYRSALSAKEASRELNANKLYGEAYKQIVKQDDELAAIAENQFFKDALLDAKKVLTTRKLDFKPNNLLESLQVVKRSLDHLSNKSNKKEPLSPETLREVEKVKNALLSWMDKKSPAYAKARKQYEIDSREIDRMNLGQVLREKVVSPLSDKGEESLAQRSAGYAQALRNEPATMKSATGFKYKGIEDVLTRKEIETANNLAKEFARASLAKTPLQPTSLPGGVDVASETVGRIPSLLARPIVVINHAIKTMVGRGPLGVEQRVDDVMAKWFLNPKDFAEVIKRLPDSQKKTALSRYAEIARNPTIIGVTLGNAQEQPQ